MTSILQLAVDVQNDIYGRRRNWEDGQYHIGIAGRIKKFSTHPKVTTVWAMMASPHTVPIKPDDPSLLPFWREPIIQSGAVEIDCAPKHRLYCTPAPDDFVMNKPDGSAFGNPLLKAFIEEKKFQAIAITGSYMEACAMGTMIDAYTFFPHLKVAMLIDLCGAYSATCHDRSVDFCKKELEGKDIGTPHMTEAAFLAEMGEPYPVKPKQKVTRPLQYSLPFQAT